MTLLQLLYTQTLQNLLAIIALQPEREVSVASKGRFLHTANSMKNAYKELCVRHSHLRSVEFLPHDETVSPTPDIQETHRFLFSLIIAEYG